MREIKFRAWDKIKCQMAQVLKLDVWGANFTQRNVYLLNGGITRHNGEFELMQFVNLFDKNGNEIYENDILLVEPLGYNESEFEKYGENYSVKKYLSVVEWILHPTNCDLQGNVGGFREWRLSPFFNSYQSIEIVGNIFENPELL